MTVFPSVVTLSVLRPSVDQPLFSTLCNFAIYNIIYMHENSNGSFIFYTPLKNPRKHILVGCVYHSEIEQTQEIKKEKLSYISDPMFCIYQL